MRKRKGWTMKTRKPQLLIALVFVFAAAYHSAWGGQVVTDEARAWAKQALAQEKSLNAQMGSNTVGVLSFFNHTARPNLEPLQKGIAIMIMTDLSKVKSLTVVERVRVQALVEEMRLGVSGLVENSTAPRVGKLLGAQWLVGGNILESPSELVQLNSAILDVPSAQVAGEPGTEGMLEGLLRMEKELVLKIVTFLKIVPSPEEAAELKKPITTSLKALIEFSKCIDESDRGNYRQAAAFCEAALVADPAFALATSTLQELTAMGVTGAAVTGAAAAAKEGGAIGTGTTVGATASAITAGATAGGIAGGAAAVGTTGGGDQPVSGF
jgi:TolB-like protein